MTSTPKTVLKHMPLSILGTDIKKVPYTKLQNNSASQPQPRIL